MAVVQISATTPQPPLQFDTDDLYVRGWYSNNFIAGDGVTPVEGGNGQTGFFYNTLCTRNDAGHLVIPARDRQATTDSNPSAVYFERLYVGGAPNQPIIDGWAIPTIYGSIIAYDELARYNAAVFILNAPSTYPTYDQMIAEILRLAAAGAQNYAAVGVLGLVQMSWPPDVASEPTAWSESDPRVGNVRGTLTAASVPVADGTQDLIDSPITYDGIDISIQSLNAFQAGDYQDVQNGSYVSVNDSTGRADLFAGSDDGDEYAGVAAVCGTGDAEVFLQSTDYTNVYGHKGITRIGDGEQTNNLTMLEVDDDLELIKLTNVPTSDPAVENAIWSDGGALKISAG